jgi:hypothetical protein
MGLRDHNAAFLRSMLEDLDGYGAELAFDVSSPELEWHNTSPGAIAAEWFTVCGIQDVLTSEATDGGDDGVVLESFNVTVATDALIELCGGIPTTGVVVTAKTRVGTITGVVERGRAHVDSELGRVHYYLSDLRMVP